MKTVKRSIKRSPPKQTRRIPVRRNVPNFVFPVALPSDQVAITQGFNNPVDYSNLNPNRIQAHEGIDFAPVGNARNIENIPVVAIQSGRVTQVRAQDGGYGRYVRLEFDDGVLGAIYAHLDDVTVNVGDRVNAGDVIGTMGNTGRSTGRHLHFNLLDLRQGRGDYIYPQVIDPTPFLTGSNAQTVNTSPPRSTREKPAPRPIGEGRGKVPTPVIQDNDYPPGMPGTSGTPISAVDQSERPQQTLSGYGLPPLFSTEDVSEPTLGTYTPQSIKDSVTGIPSAILGGIFAQGITETGEFDLLQAIGLGSGDEREEYIKQYTPYIVLAIVGILLILVGVARLVFNPNPLK